MPLKILYSFRTRLLIGVVIPVFLIQLIGVFIDLSQLKDRYHTALQVEASLVTELVGEAMVLPLWDFDMSQVQNLIDGLLDNGTVGKVELQGPDNSVLASGQSDWFSAHSTDLSVSHQLNYDHAGQLELLGELFVTMTTDSVTAALNRLVIQKIFASTVILTLIALSLFLVLSQLARPLAAMSNAISSIGGGDLSCPIPGMARNDEIGMVAQALDTWRKNEVEVVELRAQNDETSRRERKRIRSALESTRDGVLLADETGQVVFCNSNAARFFDGAKLGKPLNFQAWLQHGVASKIDQQIRAERIFQFEATVSQKSNDGELNLLVRGGPILDANGENLGTVVLSTDHTEQARQTARAKYLSEHDSLTGLPNRRLMEETLDEWVRKQEQETSILLADLDHFKLINDTLGHPVGDSLLQHVARAVAARAGDNELAARLGGDEFAILAKGPNSTSRLSKIAQSLIDELTHPQQVNERVLHTGLSVGISTVCATERNALDGIRRADLALYEAKNKGRGCLEVFHSDLEAVVQRKSLLDTELRKALKNNEIYPAYQMQTDLNGSEIVGFEALARWNHPTLGVVSPAEFINVAEETGLITELTYQIMVEAARTAAEWTQEGFTGRIAVNLSPKLFSAEVGEFVSDCLLAANCPSSAIEVEITETVVLADGTTARLEIEALQRLGVTIALDDFGMGYSSLSYLQKFPVDKIKIDRAFVSKLPDSAETRAIVVAITDLGHALGMKVTGEGAETEVHRDYLRQCNVDFVQGYVDGRPMTKEDATAMLRSRSPYLKAS